MRTKIFCTLSALFFTATSVYAQSIAQGTDIIGLGIRLGVYNTIVHDKGNNTSSNGRAGDFIYPISFDKGISDRLTIGAQFRYNSFILAKDTTGNQINQAYGIDLGVDGAFHLVRSQHTDLYIQAFLGYGYLKLANTNLNNQGTYTASGVTYGLELGARFYLGDHFGILLNFGYAGYYYPNGVAKGLGGASDHLSIFFTGTTYGTGLCYKF